jgi:hypothetical protein
MGFSDSLAPEYRRNRGGCPNEWDARRGFALIRPSGTPDQKHFGGRLFSRKREKENQTKWLSL